MVIGVTSCSHAAKDDDSYKPWSCSSTVDTDASALSLNEAKSRAAKGEPLGAVALAIRYGSGDGVQRDRDTARLWMQKAADEGCPPAQDAIGEVYDNGLSGVPVDHQAAYSWYMKAAAQDDALAQYSVGLLYQLGQGVSKDDAQAFYWYGLAADKHQLPQAQYAVARAYAYGTGVGVDYQKAHDYALKAALQNYPMAQMMLAAGYWNGAGNTSRDKAEALKWMLLAQQGRMAREDVSSAGAIIRLWKSQMSGQQIAQAQERANQFRTEYGRETNTDILNHHGTLTVTHGNTAP